MTSILQQAYRGANTSDGNHKLHSTEGRDDTVGIKTPMRLAKKFGASIYAAAREYARTHHKACVVYVLEPIEFPPGGAARAFVRRIEPSPSFKHRFGIPQDVSIGIDHPLGKLLPIGRRMTRPTMLVVADRNGARHECVAEAFDTGWNVLILVCPTRELSTETIILSGTKDRSAAI